MDTITKAHYRIDGENDFSGDILRDATEVSRIKMKLLSGGRKDSWGNRMPQREFYQIELHDIAENARKPLRDKWCEGAYIYFLLELDGKIVVQTTEAVLFDMAGPLSSLFADIPQDKVVRRDTRGGSGCLNRLLGF